MVLNILLLVTVGIIKDGLNVNDMQQDKFTQAECLMASQQGHSGDVGSSNPKKAIYTLCANSSFTITFCFTVSNYSLLDVKDSKAKTSLWVSRLLKMYV